MVIRAKQTTGTAPKPGSSGATAPAAIDPATYVPNFSRSPASWRPAGENVIDSLTFVQLLSDRAGRTTFVIVNTGVNPVLISNASTGAGAITLNPSASYDVDTEGELWVAMTPAGATTVDVVETYGPVPQSEIRRPNIPRNSWGLR
jgi:hypothetical protein